MSKKAFWIPKGLTKPTPINHVFCLLQQLAKHHFQNCSGLCYGHKEFSALDSEVAF